VLRYVSVSLLLAAIIVARRPDAVTRPQFWAEDGYVFFYENLTLGFPRALATLYQGFPYLTHRLIAFAGGLVPFAAAPRIYTTSTIALTALILASFSLPGFRHLVHSDGLRVLFGVTAVCLPYDREVLSTPTNLGWFVAIWLSLLSVMRLPAAPWRIGLLTLAGGVAIFSTPLAALNLPLWLLRAWHGRRRRVPAEVVASLIFVAALAAVVVVTRNLGTARSLVSIYPGGFLAFVADRLVGFVLSPAALRAVHDAGTVAVGAVAVIVLAVLFAAVWVGRSRSLTAVLVALYFFLGSMLLLLLGRPVLLLLAWPSVSYRYTIFPMTMLVLGVVAALDGLPAGMTRRLAGVALAGWFVWAWSSRFAVRPFIDQHWPHHATRLEQKLASGSREPLIIPMNPPWAPLRFDAPAE